MLNWPGWTRYWLCRSVVLKLERKRRHVRGFRLGPTARSAGCGQSGSSCGGTHVRRMPQAGSTIGRVSGSHHAVVPPRMAATSSVMSIATGHQVMQRPQPTQPETPYWSIHEASLCVSH